MTRASAWQRLEASLRRLVRMRELDAPPELIANEVALAKQHWSRVPPAPAGTHTVWPDDIRALAKELGFEPDPRAAPTPDRALTEGIARARKYYAVAAEIRQAIELSGGVVELAVELSETTLVLRGTARDAVARDRAVGIAQGLAPAASVDNQLRLLGDGLERS